MSSFHALMLEGPKRGKVFVSYNSILYVAELPRMSEYVSVFPTTEVFITKKAYSFLRMHMFGAIINVWVPDDIESGEQQNMWALAHLIDPAIQDAMMQCSQFPPKWTQPKTVKVQAERTREIDN